MKKKEIEKYLPESINLNYIDYGDNLNNKVDLIQECITNNSLSPIDEYVFDALNDQKYDEISRIREEVLDKMEKDGVYDRDFDDLSLIEEIEEAIIDNDESTPVEDLLSNTWESNYFYSIGYEVDENDPYEPRNDKGIAIDIARILGISNISEIEEILDNSYDGGEVRIYFRAAPKELISEGDNFKSIHFSGKVAIAVANSRYGSGWYGEIDCNIKLPFDRNNLFLDEAIKYSFCTDVCGFTSDWCKTKMNLSYEEVNKEIEKSHIGEYLMREKEMDDTFKNGGCTHGDIKMSRHRNVEYKNSFPCGWVCKDCGTFWID